MLYQAKKKKKKNLFMVKDGTYKMICPYAKNSKYNRGLPAFYLLTFLKQTKLETFQWFLETSEG